jgi:hypothetical protein
VVFRGVRFTDKIRGFVPIALDELLVIPGGKSLAIDGLDIQVAYAEEDVAGDFDAAGSDAEVISDKVI